MPTFFVTSRNALRRKCHRELPTHVVSLIDVDSGHVRTPSCVSEGNHLTRRFDDVLFEPFGPNPNWWGPTEKDVKVLAEFCRRLPADAKCVVHCEAGVSRSSATALAFHVFHNGFEGAVEWLLTEREVAMPNPILTKLFDREFGFDGKLHALGEMVASMRVNRVYGN